MRRFVRSETFTRMRLANGALLVIFGAIVLYRTGATFGLSLAALPAYVLGLAMVALGIVRSREFIATRRPR